MVLDLRRLWRSYLILGRAGETEPIPLTSAEFRWRGGPTLDEAWAEVEHIVKDRPYPGRTEGDGGWMVHLIGYPDPSSDSRPYMGPPEERYHAWVMPGIDSHHGNAIYAIAPTPIQALQKLAQQLRDAA